MEKNLNPNNPYFKQVQLLVSILSILNEHPVFALKGGTAINLFIRDLPRLSVDIDLAYVPLHDRTESLKTIHTHLSEMAHNLETKGLRVQKNNAKQITRLTISNSQSQIKIEISPVLRGTVHPTVIRSITPKAEALFGYVEVKTLSFEDLYAGKICAALDRQHPRDLYDIKTLLANEGISEKLKNTFLVYLISHPRPMCELLNPNCKSLEEIYTKEFRNMTTEVVPLPDLIEARKQLIKNIQGALNDQDKEFLLSIKKRQANWEHFYYPEVRNLPAIKWKLHNLEKMPESTHKQAVQKLEEFLTKAKTS